MWGQHWTRSAFALGAVMAWIEKRGEVFRISFRLGEQRVNQSLKTSDELEAKECLARVRENLRRVERGQLAIPATADPVVFLLSDGRVESKPMIEKPRTLRYLFDHYEANYPATSKEQNTRYTEKIHFRHFLRIIGDIPLNTITTETLQAYVTARQQAKSRSGEPISQMTVKKELGTFASIWNKWAVPQGMVSVPAPTQRLVIGKTKASLPFQTFEQIKRKIAAGESEDLWDALFLNADETAKVLEFAKDKRPAWFYPMLAFAAHTGARRSEMIRSLVEDIDFKTGTVLVREKKKERGTEMSFRHVPLSPFLRGVLKEWIGKHPGGRFTFCRKPDRRLSVQMTARAYPRAFKKGKWVVLRGWHVHRHSFISICVAKGVDQRIIDEWVGHTTEAMRRRYRHLYPELSKAAMQTVFG